MGIVKSDEDRECRTNRAGQHQGAVDHGHGSGAQVGKGNRTSLGDCHRAKARMELEETPQPPDTCQTPA